ncbi:hypothetical protein [Taibaiella koreensis]|uniref:hypothetical protein n=1 Tax=Taibaiella koreensis TaxID=1268548 RepID=UPI000E59FF67|nr:hypothetical protein [Taibaiella koreensis]
MRKIILFAVLFLLLIIAGYVYWNYYNVYEEGRKEGILYSFSIKGSVFKTHEGVILQPGLRPARTGGLNTNEFHFSVSDQGLADSLEKLSGMQIEVHYKRYRKSLPWRGDNYNNDNKERGQYVVDKIESSRKPDNAYNNF